MPHVITDGSLFFIKLLVPHRVQTNTHEISNSIPIPCATEDVCVIYNIPCAYPVSKNKHSHIQYLFTITDIENLSGCRVFGEIILGNREVWSSREFVCTFIVRLIGFDLFNVL